MGISIEGLPAYEEIRSWLDEHPDKERFLAEATNICYSRNECEHWGLDYCNIPSSDFHTLAYCIANELEPGSRVVTAGSRVFHLTGNPTNAKILGGVVSDYIPLLYNGHRILKIMFNHHPTQEYQIYNIDPLGFPGVVERDLMLMMAKGKEVILYGLRTDDMTLPTQLILRKIEFV